MIIHLIFLAMSIVNNSIPITDCNLYLSNGNMKTGYFRDYTIYSEDCILDWDKFNLAVYEDGSFLLSFAEVAHTVYFPLVTNYKTDDKAGYGFTCQLQNENDHVIVFCQSETILDDTPESVIQLIAIDDNTFVGCLSFGLCEDK